MISRRNLAAVVPLLVLTRCAGLGGAGGGVTFDQAKAYSDDLILAVLAAAQTYVVSPGAKEVPTVLQIQQDLLGLKTAIDGIENVTDARSITLQIIGFVQQLAPLVMPFLGPAGAAVPVALAVLQAFVVRLPPPPSAPTSPPAALHRKAMTYRPK